MPPNSVPSAVTLSDESDPLIIKASNVFNLDFFVVGRFTTKDNVAEDVAEDLKFLTQVFVGFMVIFLFSFINIGFFC